MTPVSLGDSVWLHFGTSSTTTGAAANADSTPTVTVAEDGTDMGYAPTVTNVATGLYKVQIDATAGNGFEAGRRYSVYAVATVGGVTGRDGIGEFEVLATDLNTGVASVTGAVGSVTGAVGSVTSAVTVGTINANAVNASALAADAVTEIQSGLATSAALATVQADTDDIQTRLPAALVGGRMDVSVGAMQADTITAAAIAAGAIGSSEAPLLANLDATVSSRLAAASYTAPLDAAGTRAAVGLAAANLDTQLAALATLIGTRAAPGDAMTLAAAAVDSIWDEAIDGGYSARELVRGFASALMAKLSGADLNTPVFRDLADTKDRINATTDASGNRTAVTLDLA